MRRSGSFVVLGLVLPFAAACDTGGSQRAGTAGSVAVTTETTREADDGTSVATSTAPPTTTTSTGASSTTTTTVPARPERWERLPDAPVTPGIGTSAVWTSQEFIVVGGMPTGRVEEAGMTAAAAAYEPSSRRWRLLPPMPGAGRSLHSAIWTGTEMIVWGGRRSGDYGGDGAAYNPTTNKWSTMKPPQPPPGATYRGGQVWTGQEMLVSGEQDHRQRSVAYRPATEAWRALPPQPPVMNYSGTAVWTGAEMLLWGAVYDCSGDCTQTATGQAGFRYQPPY